MDHDELPVKTVFLDDLEAMHVDTLDLAEEDRLCVICKSDELKPLVRLHGNHILCEQCLEDNSHLSNLCPFCRSPLFQLDQHDWRVLGAGDPVRVSINNDRENLARCRELTDLLRWPATSWGQRQAEYEMHVITTERMWIMLEGQHTPAATQYGAYPDAKPTAFRADVWGERQDDLHVLDAAHLGQQLGRRNRRVFADANRRPPPAKPTIACHPFAGWVEAEMRNALDLMDGEVATGAQVLCILQFVQRGLTARAQWAKDVAGAEAYVGHMIRDIAGWHAGIDVQPRGQAVRVFRSENDEQEVQRVGRWVEK